MQNQIPHREDHGQDDAYKDYILSFPSTSGISNPSRSLFYQNQNIITISLPSLPLIVLTQILDSLFTSDICSLSCVNKFFSDFISSLYTPSVTLPGPHLTPPTSYVLSTIDPPVLGPKRVDYRKRTPRAYLQLRSLRYILHHTLRQRSATTVGD